MLIQIIQCGLERPVCSRCTRFPKQCKYESKFILTKSSPVKKPARPKSPPHGSPKPDPSTALMRLGNPAVQQQQQQQALPQPLTPLPSPLLSSRTARFLLHHFGTQTAPVLFPLAPPAFGRRLVATAAHTPHLLHALLAAACSHHARLVGADAAPQTTRAVLALTNRAVAGLGAAVARPDEMLRVETAMTAMALCTNDVCDGGDARQWRVHLAGVKALLDAFAEEERRKRGAGVVDPFAEYLAKWFATMDTAARVSGLEERGIGSFEGGYWALLESGTCEEDAVDEFCGYSLKLMPVLARIGELATLRRTQGVGNPPEEGSEMQWSVSIDCSISAQAEELECKALSILKCAPLRYISSYQEPQRARELQSTNLAFVKAALLHLHRRVMSLPKHHVKVRDDIMGILAAIDNIPISSTANILALWPVFSAGCETDDAQERDVINRRMLHMQTLGMGNYKRARAALLDYWSSNSPLCWDLYFKNSGFDLVLF